MLVTPDVLANSSARLPDDLDPQETAEWLEAMEAVRDVCSTVSSIRKAKHLRVRLPLNSLTVAMPDAQRLEPFTGIIADEVGRQCRTSRP